MLKISTIAVAIASTALKIRSSVFVPITYEISVVPLGGVNVFPLSLLFVKNVSQMLDAKLVVHAVKATATFVPFAPTYAS